MEKYQSVTPSKTKMHVHLGFRSTFFKFLAQLLVKCSLAFTVKFLPLRSYTTCSIVSA